MIEIKNLTLQRGLKVLLDKANATVNPGQRVGLIGKNGTGKSSLFALIKGEITQDGGDVSIPKNWRLASVSQETPDLDISALDYVLQGDAELQTLQTALRQAEAQNDGMKQAEYHAKLEEIDAYTAPARAAKLLNGLGFSQEEHSRPVKSFSGGWRMRLNLAQALICRADLLLLDEPTNHLDLETVLWLENHLASLPCTQIIISHDRDFLNAATPKPSNCPSKSSRNTAAITIFTKTNARSVSRSNKPPMSNSRRKSNICNPLSTASKPKPPKPFRRKAA